MKAAQPLFVTRFSLSPRTAIGVQTRLIVENFPEWHHVYWRRYELAGQHERSICAENAVIARSTKLSENKLISGTLSRLNVAFWDGDTPTARGRAFFRKLKSKVSSIYFAPIDASDARRMKAIAEIIEVPFVVHFWDFLDDGIRRDPATRWLTERAKTVYALNQAMLDDIASLRPDAQILLFTRRASPFLAKRQPGTPLKILLIGDIISYEDGVHRLLDAVALLRAQGCEATVRYIGRPRILKVLGLSHDRQIEAVGFMPSDEARDRAIAECDVGFLPGPSADPAVNPRSRYSIPSRVLDFIATGLPFVGCLHPDAAAFRYCADLGLDELAACKTSEEIATALERLAAPEEWSRWSQANLQAFSSLVRPDRFDALKEDLLHPTGPGASRRTSSVAKRGAA